MASLLHKSILHYDNAMQPIYLHVIFSCGEGLITKESITTNQNLTLKWLYPLKTTLVKSFTKSFKAKIISYNHSPLLF